MPQSPSEQRLRLKPIANSRSHGDWIGHVARSSLIVRDRSSPDRPRRSSLGLLAPRDRHCPHRRWRSVQSRSSLSLVVARPSCSTAPVQVLPASLTLFHSLTLALFESLSLKWKLWLSLSLSLSLYSLILILILCLYLILWLATELLNFNFIFINIWLIFWLFEFGFILISYLLVLVGVAVSVGVCVCVGEILNY